MKQQKRTRAYEMSGRCWMRWHVWGKYLQGTFFTPWGIVSVYSQGHDGSRPLTLLEFCHAGQKFEQRIEKTFSKRGLAILAGKFIRREIIG